MPCPTALRAVPMAAVVFPLPGPVFTMIRPRRSSDIGTSAGESLIVRGGKYPCQRRAMRIHGSGVAGRGSPARHYSNTGLTLGIVVSAAYLNFSGFNPSDG